MDTTTYNLSAEECAVVARTEELVRGSPPESLSEDEKQGLRAFLQRAETRLSTYQRVAGAFLNGAGLLVLLPGLARESLFSTMIFALSHDSICAKFVFLPWLLALFVPLYAFILLLRDLVQFYFSPRFLLVDPLKITRFSLAGVTLPYDESIEAKAQVIALKAMDPSYAQFMLGGTSSKTVKKVHSETRAGKAAFPLRLEIMDSLSRGARDIDMSNIDKVGVTLSLGGSLDLSLVGEVARMEASVCRHVLLLRKLVLRYTKALILFVWTTLASLAVAAILDIATLSVPAKSSAALFAYGLWAGLSVWLIRRPLSWIDQLIPKEEREQDQKIFRDPDLELFEIVVTTLLLGGAW
jgi:hypothetical protein